MAKDGKDMEERRPNLGETKTRLLETSGSGCEAWPRLTVQWSHRDPWEKESMDLSQPRGPISYQSVASGYSEGPRGLSQASMWCPCLGLIENVFHLTMLV